VQIKVKVRKPDQYLRPEMNATVAVISDDTRVTSAHPYTAGKPVVMAPESALRSGAVFVFLDGRALRRAVKTGAVSGSLVRIEDGLIGGEDLIVNPPAGLKDGDRVRQKS